MPGPLNGALLDTNSPEFLDRVDTLTKILNAHLNRFEDSPQVLIPVLMRQLAITIVTETYHLPKSQVLGNSLKSFKDSMKQAWAFLDTVMAQEEKANEP